MVKIVPLDDEFINVLENGSTCSDSDRTESSPSFSDWSFVPETASSVMSDFSLSDNDENSTHLTHEQRSDSAQLAHCSEPSDPAPLRHHCQSGLHFHPQNLQFTMSIRSTTSNRNVVATDAEWNKNDAGGGLFFVNPNLPNLICIF